MNEFRNVGKMEFFLRYSRRTYVLIKVYLYAIIRIYYEIFIYERYKYVRILYYYKYYPGKKNQMNTFKIS